MVIALTLLKGIRKHALRVAGLGCLALFPAFETPLAAGGVPAAETVVRRILDRAAAVSTNTQPYQFTKRTTVEELDHHGNVRSTKVKLYDVTQMGGVTRARLVEMDAEGRRLDPDNQAKREESARDQLTRSSKGGRRGQFERLLTEELFRRFDWTVERRETLEGRTLLRVSFLSRDPDASADKLMDRVINRMTGVIWVDERDWEIARAEMRLTDRVTLWAGLLGVLDNFQLTLLREPGADQVWYVKQSNVELSGRKLFGTVRYRAKETSENFHRAE